MQSFHSSGQMQCNKNHEALTFIGFPSKMVTKMEKPCNFVCKKRQAATCFSLESLSCFFPSFFPLFNYHSCVMTHGRKQGCLVSLCKPQKTNVGQQSMYRMSCKLECDAFHIVSAYTQNSRVLKVLVEHYVLEKKKKKKGNPVARNDICQEKSGAILFEKLLCFRLLFAKLSRRAETREHHEVQVMCKF